MIAQVSCVESTPAGAFSLGRWLQGNPMVSEWDVRAWMLRKCRRDGRLLSTGDGYRLRNGELEVEFRDVASDTFGGSESMYCMGACNELLTWVVGGRI